MPKAKKKSKARKPKTMVINMTATITGQAGIDQFARAVAVLYKNGFEEQVRQLVNEMIAVAKRKGIKTPPELEKL